MGHGRWNLGGIASAVAILGGWPGLVPGPGTWLFLLNMATESYFRLQGTARWRANMRDDGGLTNDRMLGIIQVGSKCVKAIDKKQRMVTKSEGWAKRPVST